MIALHHSNTLTERSKRDAIKRGTGIYLSFFGMKNGFITSVCNHFQSEIIGLDIMTKLRLFEPKKVLWILLVSRNFRCSAGENESSFSLKLQLPGIR